VAVQILFVLFEENVELILTIDSPVNRQVVQISGCSCLVLYKVSIKLRSPHLLSFLTSSVVFDLYDRKNGFKLQLYYIWMLLFHEL
jgi:hypothetical protein